VNSLLLGSLLFDVFEMIEHGIAAKIHFSVAGSGLNPVIALVKATFATVFVEGWD
jgi:hypothetical protein